MRVSVEVISSAMPPLEASGVVALGAVGVVPWPAGVLVGVRSHPTSVVVSIAHTKSPPMQEDLDPLQACLASFVRTSIMEG